MPPLGLIPAHAGKTWRSSCQSCWWGAHPRSRGENGYRLGHNVTFLGSSPLTRGKLDARRLGGDRPRLIPAHAGKTSPLRAGPTCPQAHPRSRGENSLTETSQEIDWGSSPLTRGKRQRDRARRRTDGLIPAHAGKTPDRLAPALLARAHPRSRGENSWLPSDTRTTLGSSPLTRGKRSYGEAGSTWDGLIPAHAGKTPRTVRQP